MIEKQFQWNSGFFRRRITLGRKTNFHIVENHAIEKTGLPEFDFHRAILSSPFGRQAGSNYGFADKAVMCFKCGQSGTNHTGRANQRHVSKVLDASRHHQHLARQSIHR